MSEVSNLRDKIAIHPLLVLVGVLGVLDYGLTQLAPPTTVPTSVFLAQAASASKVDCFAEVRQPDGSTKKVGEDISIDKTGKESKPKADPNEPAGKCKVEYTDDAGKGHTVDDVRANDLEKLLDAHSEAPFSSAYTPRSSSPALEPQTTTGSIGSSYSETSAGYGPISNQEVLDMLNGRLETASAESMPNEEFNSLVQQRDMLEEYINNPPEPLPAMTDTTGGNTFGAPSSGIIGDDISALSPDIGNARPIRTNEMADYDVTSNYDVGLGTFFNADTFNPLPPDPGAPMPMPGGGSGGSGPSSPDTIPSMPGTNGPTNIPQGLPPWYWNAYDEVNHFDFTNPSVGAFESDQGNATFDQRLAPLEYPTPSNQFGVPYDSWMNLDLVKTFTPPPTSYPTFNDISNLPAWLPPATFNEFTAPYTPSQPAGYQGPDQWNPNYQPTILDVPEIASGITTGSTDNGNGNNDLGARIEDGGTAPMANIEDRRNEPSMSNEEAFARVLYDAGIPQSRWQLPPDLRPNPTLFDYAQWNATEAFRSARNWLIYGSAGPPSLF